VKKSELHKLIEEKLTILDTSDKVFAVAVKTVEDSLLQKIIKFLKKFTTRGGNLDKKVKSNQKLLLALNKQIKKILLGTRLQSETGKYLKNFDKIERISKQIISGVNNINAGKLSLSIEKRLAIEEITEGLLNGTNLNRAIGKPIRKILFRHVTRGSTTALAEKELINHIRGSGGKLGSVSRYVRQLSIDALNRYDGTINQKAVEEFGLDGFRFVGSLIVTSAQSCIEMVLGTGRLGKFMKNGKYRVKDIPKIIKILSKMSGFIKGTNASNYFINRNHYGCRHTLIPTILLSKDKDSFDENVVDDIKEINKAA